MLINQMIDSGIWLNKKLIDKVLTIANE